MRGRGGFTIIGTAVILMLGVSCVVSPDFRYRLFDFASDCIDAVRDLWDFILRLFGGT